MPQLSDETRYKLLKLLEKDPGISQRRVADSLGISLGKANYCLNALIKKGLIKVKNFRNSQNKVAYVYILTTQGLEDKAKVTMRFLKLKINEYEELEKEIEQLRREASDLYGVTTRKVSETSQ